MLLYLITHARTQMQREVDSTRWRLSDAGREQAAALAEQPFWATVNRIVLSSEPKTRLTVQPLLEQRSLPILVNERLNELRRPGWVGDYAGRVEQCFAQPTQPAGDWERAVDALVRVVDVVEDLHTQFPAQTLALVGHGLTLSLFRAHLLGQYVSGEIRVDIADWRALPFAAVALAEIGVDTSWLRQDFVPVGNAAGRGA